MEENCVMNLRALEIGAALLQFITLTLTLTLTLIYFIKPSIDL